MPSSQYSNSEGQSNPKGVSSTSAQYADTWKPTTSQSLQLQESRLVVCEVEKDKHKCAGGSKQVALPKEGRRALA